MKISREIHEVILPYTANDCVLVLGSRVRKEQKEFFSTLAKVNDSNYFRSTTPKVTTVVITTSFNQSATPVHWHMIPYELSMLSFPLQKDILLCIAYKICDVQVDFWLVCNSSSRYVTLTMFSVVVRPFAASGHVLGYHIATPYWRASISVISVTAIRVRTKSREE